MEKDFKNSELYQAPLGVERESGYGAYLFFALFILLALFFRVWWTNNYGGVVVDGSSMYKTLRNGEKLLMRYADDGEQAERGDVIVVYVGNYEECKGISGGYLIKRLIAIEGDRVKCTDGQISICYAGTTEYVLLNEPYAYYMNKTAYDFVSEKYGEEGLQAYLNRCEALFKNKKTKLRKLKMSESEIHSDFIERDLRNTQYIAKKSLAILGEICRT